MSSDALITIDIADGIWSIAINRPRARNALNGAAMQQLKSAFRAFDNEDSASVAVLSGRGGSFCAGADLKEMADAANYEAWAGDLHGMLGAPLSKPLIGAVEGHAVAGGLGVALYCDVRIASSSAVFGVFCRRFGVPMSDGSTIRLPRLIGESRALDMMLSGRAVQAEEAQNIGLVASVVPEGQAHSAAMEYARRLTVFPQLALRSDRQSLLEQSGHDLRTALRNETRLAATAKAQQAQSGAQAFAAGIGRHGQNSD